MRWLLNSRRRLGKPKTRKPGDEPGFFASEASTLWQASCSKTISFEGLDVKYEKGVKMSLQLQIEEMPGYLAARFTGVGVVEDAWQQFELIAEQCNRTNNNKLLLDYTGFYADISLTDRYYLGERKLIFAQYNLKVATVARPEQIDPQKFGALVSQNRGVNADTFSNVQTAEEWLLEPLHKTKASRSD
jgi:hypothetical protein